LRLGLLVVDAMLRCCDAGETRVLRLGAIEAERKGEISAENRCKPLKVPTKQTGREHNMGSNGRAPVPACRDLNDYLDAVVLGTNSSTK
jgi:hypothetical protein